MTDQPLQPCETCGTKAWCSLCGETIPHELVYTETDNWGRWSMEVNTADHPCFQAWLIRGEPMFSEMWWG